MQVNISVPEIESVIVLRILAGIIIAISFAYSIYWAVSASSVEFWIFLGHLATPLGIGFLLIAAAEILKAIRRQ